MSTALSSPVEISDDAKKDFIIDAAQTVSIEVKKQLLEIILNNESSDVVKNFPDGSRINLNKLNSVTIDDLYNIVRHASR